LSFGHQVKEIWFLSSGGRFVSGMIYRNPNQDQILTKFPVDKRGGIG